MLPPRENPLAALLLGATSAGTDYLQSQRQDRQYLNRLEHQRRIQQNQKLADLLSKEQAYEQVGLPKAYASLDPSIVKDLLKTPEPSKPISFEDVYKLLKYSGYDPIDMRQFSLEDFQEIIDRANQLMPQFGRENAIVQALRELPYPPTDKQQPKNELAKSLGTPMKEAGEESYLSPLKKGLESSISGRLASILRGEPVEEYEQRIALNDPGLIDRSLKALGQFGGDFPYILSGGVLGAKTGAGIGSVLGPFGAGAGGVIGGGAGAFGLRDMIDTALTEFHKAQSKGFDGSFEDYIKAAGKSLKSGVEGAVEGGIFGILSEALPVLKAVSPEFKAFAEKAPRVAKGGIEATGLIGAKALAKQEIPSKEEVVDTFVQILGLNLMSSLPKKTGGELTEKVRRSGIPPEDFATATKAYIEENKLDARRPEDVVRAIQDVTKTYKGPEKTAAQDVMKALRSLEEPKPKEVASRLAERPTLEETLESERKDKEKRKRPLTEKEKAKREVAKERSKELEKEMAQIEDDIKALQNAIESPKRAKDVNLYRRALEAKARELENIQTQYEDVRAIAEKGVEPFREEKIQESIQKHMKELKTAASDPQGTTAQEWEKMFSRDQKYLNEFMKILQKGRLPEAPYKDRYIKTLEAYQEAYKNQLNNLKTLIKEIESEYKEVGSRTKSGKSLKTDLDTLKRLENLTTRNYGINEAKIGKQKEKLSQLYEMKKPGSSLVKHFLKEMRPDITELQKEFINQKKHIDKAEQQIESATKPKIQELGKLIDQYKKNPNEKKLVQISRESGVDISDLKEAQVEGKKVGRQLIEMAKENKSEKEVKQTVDSNLERFLKGRNKLAKAALVGMMATEAQELVFDFTGIRPPLSSITPIIVHAVSGSLGAFSTLGAGALYKQLRNVILEKNQRSRYKHLKGPIERRDFIRDLQKRGYSKTALNRIMKSD